MRHNWLTYSSKREAFLLSKSHPQSFSSIICRKNIEKPEMEVSFFITGVNDHLKRMLHVSTVHRDIETGLKGIGAGLAATGTIGAGIGIGLLGVGSLNGIARNPSAGKEIKGLTIMLAAFAEAMGLMSCMLGFVLGI